MRANSRVLIWYLGGSVLWLLVLSLMMATKGTIVVLVSNYVGLTLGFALGVYGNSLVKRQPWLLLFVPIAPLVLGFFAG